MNIKIDTFCYSIHKLAKALDTDHVVPLLNKFQQRDNHIQNEAQAIRYLGKYLVQKSSNRKTKEVFLPAQEINHHKQLEILADSVRELESSYNIRYSSSNARHLFQRISFFFKRYQIRKAARKVDSLILNFQKINNVNPIVIEPQKPNDKLKYTNPISKNLLIQNFTIIPQDLLQQEESAELNVIGLNPNDMNRLFGVYQYAKHICIKIRKKTFVCRPLADIKEGAIGITDSQIKDLFPNEGNELTSAPLSLLAIPLTEKDLSLSKITILLTHEDQEKIEFSNTEEIKK